MNQRIEILPLGGIGEFGMNCLGIRFEGEMIIIDAGMGFPEETPYGVDISIPDFEFLDEYRDEIKALVLTHGHEDHIGSVPYLLKRFQVPVYASRLTAAFVERKLEEHGIFDETDLNIVNAGDTIEIGAFSVGFIHASHSLVDCFSLAVTTPVGTIIHTGDYKVDESPVIGRPYDLEALGEYGDEGILALLGDSTNATVPGRTPSEQDVIPALQEIIESAPGRVIVSTFSSSIHRLQVVFDLAQVTGRRVCPLGRSLLQNIEIAERLNFLDTGRDCMIALEDARRLDDDEIVYLVTGSQAETRAVLWNLATQSYKGLSIQPGDTVILSARIIPGNGKRISKMVGEIYKRGGNVIEDKRRLIHVSGHAAQEDIRILTETARPKFLVPIHGEYRMLYRHKEFAVNEMGFAEENVKIIETGDVLELTADSAKIIDNNEIGRTFIGEFEIGEITYETVRERKRLGFSGVISLVIMIDSRSRELTGEPLIEIQGVPGIDPLNGVMEGARQSIADAVNSMTVQQLADEAWVKEALRIHLRKYIKDATGVKPVVVPTIVSV